MLYSFEKVRFVSRKKKIFASSLIKNLTFNVNRHNFNYSNIFKILKNRKNLKDYLKNFKKYVNASVPAPAPEATEQVDNTNSFSRKNIAVLTNPHWKIVNN